MKYRAVIFDLDGTAIPNRRDGMPSKRLVKIIGEIKKKIPVSAATGRPITMCRHILRELGLTSPCIVSAGTQIVDPVTEKVLWTKQLAKEQVEAVIEVVRPYNYPVFFSSETVADLAQEKIVKGDENAICIEPVTPEDTTKIIAGLSAIPGIVAYPVMSWTEGSFDIHVTHKEATKKHSLELLLGMLGVDKAEVIGFGDSNNDLPIFEGVGYKVAMANGSEELKKAADEIAPHAESDGLAEMLEKLLAESKLNGDNS